MVQANIIQTNLCNIDIQRNSEISRNYHKAHTSTSQTKKINIHKCCYFYIIFIFMRVNCVDFLVFLK